MVTTVPPIEGENAMYRGQDVYDSVSDAWGEYIRQ